VGIFISCPIDFISADSQKIEVGDSTIDECINKIR